MKTHPVLKRRYLSLLAIAAFTATGTALAISPVALEKATLAGDEVIKTPIGTITLNDNYFDDKASQQLFDEMDYQRATQAYIWSHPLVSITTWRDRQIQAYGAADENDFVVLKSLKEKRGDCYGQPDHALHPQFHQPQDGSAGSGISGGKNRRGHP